ncbi:MAG: hypothetical protein K9J17_00630 [Flavobacteriales bacterium]|nr:hypothetical protein [Flavobacteriales bacterium]
MKTPISILILVIICTLSHAQTKVIAHKSHSGSNHSFAKAYHHNLFEINDSNFGLGPMPYRITLLDTVVAVNDTTTLLRFRASMDYFTKEKEPDYTDLVELEFESMIDTIVNDTVFTRKKPLSIIKAIDQHRYPILFRNPIEEVVFIGFKE